MCPLVLLLQCIRHGYSSEHEVLACYTHVKQMLLSRIRLNMHIKRGLNETAGMRSLFTLLPSAAWWMILCLLTAI